MQLITEDQQKIKALLNSPDEKNQRLGCNMAKSTLKWSNFEICMFILNTCEKWETRGVGMYGFEHYTYFLGKKISFDLTVHKYQPTAVFSLFMEEMASLMIKKGDFEYKYSFYNPDKGFINKFNRFIELNL